jgi:hypothetical protein
MIGSATLDGVEHALPDALPLELAGKFLMLTVVATVLKQHVPS